MRQGSIRRFAIVLGLALAIPAGVGAVSVVTAQQAYAQAIEVRGNQRVDADTIRSYFRVSPGERLDAARIDEALKALYATGLYQDVQISQQGGRVVVTVVENQTINRIAFEGNKKVKDETLAGEVQSRARGPLSRPTVQADVQRIVEVYRRQGYFNVRVEPKIIDQPNNRVDLVFEIGEDQKTTVKKIVFVGNNKFSDWKLTDVITTIKSNWLSWLSNRDIYDPERVAADQELLRRFYLKHGYADFRVLSTTVDFDRQTNGFVLTFTLDEGEQYRFGTVDIVSNIRDADPERLRRLLRVSGGKTYDAEAVEKSVEELTIELSKLGYTFAQVRPRGDRDVQNRIINVVFVIEQGPRVYVERINVRGNTRTRDWVIRREFDLLEGDPYNRVLVDRAERRLNNLGYFKKVRITNEPGSAPDRVLVNVEVEEQLTGEFSIGGGYSTADGIIGEASVGEKNFLGRGQYVRLAGTYGQRTKGAEFSFTEPYFLDTRIAAGFDIFGKASDRSQYNPVDVQTTGGTLRAGIPLREELTLGLRYSLFTRKIVAEQFLTDGNPANQELSYAYQEQLGSALTSLVGYSLTYNTLDSNRNPSRGIYAKLSQDFAGAGGDVKYVKTTAEARNYYPITDEITSMLRVSGGYVAGWGGGNLRVLDHFFQGADLVRGFAPSGIGPRDLNSTNQDPLGGTLYWGATAELIFPLPGVSKEMGLRGAVFADAGSLWGYSGRKDFSPWGAVSPASCPAGSVLSSVTGGICIADSSAVRASVGASLIWASPFGPLRFDFAYPILKEPYDKTQWFRFGAAGAF
ncbi:MAG: outer membrane protein assembly factor BamA [Bradyrhizobiaceae bacterium]|nr:outer membrane protein assembly factor BamA [Bradyrhizobiaceae bacterium]